MKNLQFIDLAANNTDLVNVIGEGQAVLMSEIVITLYYEQYCRTSL